MANGPDGVRFEEVFFLATQPRTFTGWSHYYAGGENAYAGDNLTWKKYIVDTG